MERFLFYLRASNVTGVPTTLLRTSSLVKMARSRWLQTTPVFPSAENGLDLSFALLALRSRNHARSLLIRVCRQRPLVLVNKKLKDTLLKPFD